MSLLASARVDVTHLHHPSPIRLNKPRAQLEPSALPPPPPSVSPRRVPYRDARDENHTANAKAKANANVDVQGNINVNPFLMPGRLETSATQRRRSTATVQVDDNDNIDRGDRGIMGKKTIMPLPARAALGNINTNRTPGPPSTSAKSQLLTQTQTQTVTRPPVPSFQNAIPRPSLVPDVFSGAGGGAGSTKRSVNALDLAAEGGDRGKRRVLQDIRTQDAQQRSARESEQEKWRSKWMKSFPTLTFHFDVGAQDGPGRVLKARTTKMGAVSPSPLD